MMGLIKKKKLKLPFNYLKIKNKSIINCLNSFSLLDSLKMFTELRARQSKNIVNFYKKETEKLLNSLK